MSGGTEQQVAEIMERFKKHGIEPCTKYATMYEALSAMLDVAYSKDKRIAELEKEVKKWKLEVCKGQDTNSDIEEENASLKEQLAGAGSAINRIQPVLEGLEKQIALQAEEIRTRGEVL